MEHRGALAATARMLDVNAAEAVLPDLGRQVHLVRQLAAGGAGRRGRDVGREAALAVMEKDGAARAVAGGGDGVGQRSHLAIIVFHEQEVDGLGVLRRADDAQAVARE